MPRDPKDSHVSLQTTNAHEEAPIMVPGSVTGSRRMRNRIRHPRFRIGERVRFADGTFTGTGVVDAATEDYSIIWVWTDGSAGRKMFLQGLGTIVDSIEEPDVDAERGLP